MHIDDVKFPIYRRWHVVKARVNHFFRVAGQYRCRSKLGATRSDSNRIDLAAVDSFPKSFGNLHCGHSEGLSSIGLNCRQSGYERSGQFSSRIALQRDARRAMFFKRNDSPCNLDGASVSFTSQRIKHFQNILKNGDECASVRVVAPCRDSYGYPLGHSHLIGFFAGFAFPARTFHDIGTWGSTPTRFLYVKRSQSTPCGEPMNLPSPLVL